MRQHAGLAGAGSGQHKDRALWRLHGTGLRLIQPFQQSVHDQRPPH
jgi:hypothetical protein